MLKLSLGFRIAAILFVSGFCSLVYQVTWLRLLRLVFGVSTASSAAVVAIFMGGLGLGGYLFGRRLRQAKNPLAIYAALELAIALTAGLTPFLIDLASWIYFHLGGVSTLGLPFATALRLGLSVLVLGTSTTLMGGTLPAIAQAFQRRRDVHRRDVAWLYGINTLGAVCGAFLATFWLIELLGVRSTLWLAVLCNLLLALVARQLARQEATAAASSPTDDRTALEPESSVATPPVALSPPIRLVLPAAALVGGIFFLMEIVWYRMLAPILGGSSYTFGLILSLALLGIGLGGLIYALRPKHKDVTLTDFGLSCALEAFCLILPFAAGDHLAWFAATIRPLHAFGFSGLVMSWTVVAGFVILPSALVAGYQFPLLVALLGRGRRRVGYEVGLTYAWNTAGAILGSLAGGFGLLPLLSAPHLWRLSAVLLVALALIATVLEQRAKMNAASLAPLTLSCLGLLLCTAPGPSAYWRHSPIGAGRMEAVLKDPNDLRWQINDARGALVAEAEGLESSIALLQRQQLSLQVNGKSDGSARGDAATQVMGGLVGALLHPNPASALVIGMGTGTTAGWLAEVPSCRVVDVVELEPAVVEFAHAFRWVNADVLSSPKVRVFYGDGREYVLSNPSTYDLIFSEPSNPYRAGVADLFSYDFYRSLSQRLNEGGIFMQWLQGYEVDAELVQTVLTTLGSVFSHIEIWQIHHNDLLLIATKTPLVHDLDRIRQRVETEPFKSALRWVWNVEGIEGFYSGFLVNDKLATVFSQRFPAAISTDDRPRVELSFARNVGRGQLFDLRQLTEIADALEARRPTAKGEPIDWQRVEDYLQLRASRGLAILNLKESDAVQGDKRLRYLARRAYQEGQLTAVAQLWGGQENGEPRTNFDRQMIAEALAEQGNPDALPYIEQLVELAPTEALALRARLAFRQGDPDTAVGDLLAMLRRCSSDGWFDLQLINRTLHLIEALVVTYPDAAEPLFEASAEPFTSYLLEGDRLRMRVTLALALEPDERCAIAFEAFEPHVPWEEPFLALRAKCYERAKHPLATRAWEDLGDFLAVSAPKFDFDLSASRD